MKAVHTANMNIQTSGTFADKSLSGCPRGWWLFDEAHCYTISNMIRAALLQNVNNESSMRV